MRPGVWGNRLNLDRWVPYRSAGAVGCRVFCFPHTAGNATFYRPLRHFMRAGIDFCPIELPGRAARIGEAPVTDIDRLLDTLSRTIRPLMTVPFAFFGHSTGACIAYQAARKLRAADGRRAGHLFVSARAAPDVARKGPSPHSLSDAELRAAPRRFGGTPDAVTARDELIAALLPIMRADLALAETCAGAGERVACPITAFGGVEDAIDIHSLKAWGSFTAAAFRVRLFAGGHFYLTAAGATVADEIARDLAESFGLAGGQMAEAG
jgi:medium-chain acyl-[acyl-carrier-protein] hydrolase